MTMARSRATTRIQSDTVDAIAVITRACDEYPAQLAAVPSAPETLYVRGRLVADDALAVAIVGSRRATPYGLEVAERLGAALGARGVTVVSGLARGIDSAAHRGALEAGGRTIAVLGSGVDVIYPPENRRLAARIAERGRGGLAVRVRARGPCRITFPSATASSRGWPSRWWWWRRRRRAAR